MDESSVKHEIGDSSLQGSLSVMEHGNRIGSEPLLHKQYPNMNNFSATFPITTQEKATKSSPVLTVETVSASKRCQAANYTPIKQEPTYPSMSAESRDDLSASFTTNPKNTGSIVTYSSPRRSEEGRNNDIQPAERQAEPCSSLDRPRPVSLYRNKATDRLFTSRENDGMNLGNLAVEQTDSASLLLYENARGSPSYEVLPSSPQVSAADPGDAINIRLHADYAKLRDFAGKPFKCSYCEYATVNKGNLTVHVRKHTGEKPFKCSLCDYKSVLRTGLDQHMRIHIGDKPYGCSFCEYRAVSKSNLVVHERRHNGYKPYKCPLCDYSSSDHSHLVRHTKSHKPYTCSLCEHTTVVKSEFLEHLKTHTLSDKTDISHIDFSSSTDSGDIGKAEGHAKEKPYRCSFCEYSSAYKNNVIIHVRKHTGEKPYKCSLCDYSATSSGCVSLHMRIHTGDKRYQCSVCEYKTISKSNLALHVRKHTGEKPYRCSICDYRTCNHSHLVRHIRTHTKDKLYPRSLCNYNSTDDSRLTEHVRADIVNKSESKKCKNISC